MMFQLLGDWPVNGGAMVVPIGTVLEWDPDPEAARLAGLPTAPKWRGEVLPLPMPPNAKCLDQEAYDAMVRWYAPHSDQLIRTFHYSPNVKPKGA